MTCQPVNNRTGSLAGEDVLAYGVVVGSWEVRRDVQVLVMRLAEVVVGVALVRYFWLEETFVYAKCDS